MVGKRILLIGALVAVAPAGLLLWQYNAGAHGAPATPISPIRVQIDPAGPGKENAAVTNGSTPGQLTILDKQGRQAGVCPLKHTDVVADIAGYVARVTVTQEFANQSKAPVEAVYTFPLPEDAAVDDMTMNVGSRVIRSQILRREEASEVYQAARAAGKAAALLDQERPNIFTQSVANIMPGEQVKITISYVNLLKYQDGQYAFVFPMVVGPRYIPNGGGYTEPGKRGEPSPQPQILGDPGRTPVVTDAERITPPITPPATRAGHDISVTVNLDAGLPLREVHSTPHAVTVQAHGPSRATIRLAEKESIPNRDFILHYTAAGSDMQSGILTYAPARAGTAAERGAAPAGGGYFTLILQPPSAPPRERITPKEMVFVIDQTGSQEGWPIAKAKETMRYCIQNLNPGDTFQLLGFNTELYPCFKAPVPATPQTIARALKFLEPIEGDGGTDILKSVDYALSLPDDPDRLRIVCYMTDGYVGNDMQILDCVQKHRGRARMFPFGCGNAVNRFLIEGMAREGRGVSEYVTLQSDGREAARRFYQRIADPLLLDIQVDWNGLPVEDVYPQHIPDVFSAQPIIIKGRYTQAAEGDVTIHGLLRGRPWSQTLHIMLPAAKGDGSAIETLWARERIEDLQNQDWIGAQTNHPDPQIKEEIVATALEHRLMSQYTSFVAVEERVVNAGGRQETVDVPVEMPEGVSYKGIFGDAARMELHMAAALMVGRGGVGGGGFGGGGGNPGQMMQSYSRAGRGRSGMGGPAGGAQGQLTPGLNPGDLYAYDADNSIIVRSTYGPPANEVASGTARGQAWLNSLPPAERKRALRQIKLSAVLRSLPEMLAREGSSGNLNKPGVPRVLNGRVQVEVWLNSLPADGLQRLEALGFNAIATLQANRLLLGTVAVDKLDSLIALGFVRWVEPPRIRS